MSTYVPAQGWGGASQMYPNIARSGFDGSGTGKPATLHNVHVDEEVKVAKRG